MAFDGNLNQSPALYFTYRDDGRVFEDIGLWDNGFVSVTGLEEPERVDAMFATDGTFPILGVEPALGRTFTAEDGSPGSPETVILSHRYWESRFAASPGVLGKTLTSPMVWSSSAVLLCDDMLDVKCEIEIDALVNPAILATLTAPRPQVNVSP